jgi:membrane protein YqaA with SNARE-associated domain
MSAADEQPLAVAPPAASWHHPVRRLYDWVLHWAGTRHATQALFWVAFAESSFFPIPPDVLLIAMALARPAGAMSAALVCTLASSFGGIAGYGIGLLFFDLVGRPILDAYGVWGSYLQVQTLYRQWDAWAVAVAGFTPIPYKLFTIAAGAFRIDFTTFIVASIASRGARFLLVAWIVRHWGPPVRAWVERYFNLATLIFAVLLIGGFLLVKVLL